MGSVSVDQYLTRVADSGLIPEAELRSTFDELSSAGKAADAEQFARELVQRRKLTVYQAQQCYLGKGKTLILGNYVILDKLGQGGMGLVLKAEHRRMERLVALKILAPAITKNPDALRRFQQEVKVAAKLTHPNIATAYDADIAGTTHFLVMEYVDGRDLASIVAADGRLPVPQAIDVVRQAAKGLAYAHAKGVVHRDIKPANLLLDRDGTVKILDMGLARAEDPSGHEGLTHSGEVMGTADYMAPEQALDVRKADARSDIYSLGCTLYRLLTAENMFDCQSIVEKLMAHQQRASPNLVTKRPDVPQALARIFERMVAKRPEERFQSMAELEKELAALKSGVVTATIPTHSLDADSRLTAFFTNLNQKGVNSSQPAVPVNALATSAPIAAVTIAIQKAPTEPFATAESPVEPTPEDHPMTGTFSTALSAVDLDTITTRHTTIKPFDPPVAEEAKPRARKPKPKRSLPPLQRWLLIACAVGSLLAAIGIWVIIRDKDGKEIARYPVPDGGSANIVNDPPPKTNKTKSAAPASPPMSAAAASSTQTNEDNDIDYAIERQVATEILAAQGEVTVKFDSTELHIKNLSELPKSDFYITKVLWSAKDAAPLNLTSLCRLSKLYQVELSNLDSPTPQYLEPLARVRTLETLVIFPKNKLVFAPEAVLQLKQLKTLWVKGDWNHSKLIGRIAELEHLTRFQVHVNDSSTPSFKTLATRPPNSLTSIEINTNRGFLLDEPIKVLSTLPKLSEVSVVGGGQISDDALQALSMSKSFSYLNLSGVVVNPEALNALQLSTNCTIRGLTKEQLPEVYLSQRYQNAARHLFRRGCELSVEVIGKTVLHPALKEWHENDLVRVNSVNASQGFEFEDVLDREALAALVDVKDVWISEKAKDIDALLSGLPNLVTIRSSASLSNIREWKSASKVQVLREFKGDSASVREATRLPCLERLYFAYSQRFDTNIIDALAEAKQLSYVSAHGAPASQRTTFQSLANARPDMEVLFRGQRIWPQSNTLAPTDPQK